ncbi:MAG: protein phosphatase 2C domain-containing protein [Anaerolineae bacterium]|nr:protein phosphatase 2C domain-containing protein [Anaerolineae bacterium]
MSTLEELRLPQTHETAAMLIAGGVFHLQVAYARSADSRASNDSGQDYLSVRQDGKRLAFVLCDGVSQSFVGELAARVLGEAMLQWLWQLDVSTLQTQAVQAACQQRLSALVPEVAQQVASYSLPANLPPMLGEVLEQKRQLGSESTLAAGLLDPAADKLLLVWLGDSRIRLWDQQGEITSRLGGTFLTQERWSTRRGPIGAVHVLITDLKNIQRVVAYSDGLAIMDRGLNNALTTRSLDAVIAKTGDAPTSDDVSFLEVRFSPFPEAEGEPRHLLTMAEAIQRVWSKPEPLTIDTSPEKEVVATQLPATPTLYPAPRTSPRESVAASPYPLSSQPIRRPSAPVSAPQPPVVSQAKPTGRFSRLSRVSIAVISVVAVLCLVLAGAGGMWLARKAQETPVPTATATEVVATYVVTPTVEGGGGHIQPGDPQAIKEGESVPFKFRPEEGYEVGEVWVDDQPMGKRDSYTITTISASQVLMVRFDPKTYSITLTTDNEGGTIVGEVDGEKRETPFTVQHNQPLRLLITPDEGYDVQWLKVNEEDIKPSCKESSESQPAECSHEIRGVTKAYSASVAFKLKAYTISASADSGGSISPTGKVTVTYGSMRTFEIKPGEGYQIAAVLVDNEVKEVITSTHAFTRVVQNHTIRAQFKEKTYTVALESEGWTNDGSQYVEPVFPKVVKHGEIVKFTITPPVGFRLKEIQFGDETLPEWQTQVDNAIQGDPIDFESSPIHQDIKIKVVFEQVQ